MVVGTTCLRIIVGLDNGLGSVTSPKKIGRIMISIIITRNSSRSCSIDWWGLKR